MAPTAWSHDGARAVGRALVSGAFFNLGKLACSTSGALEGCGSQVAGAYNPGWGVFATW